MKSEKSRFKKTSTLYLLSSVSKNMIILYFLFLRRSRVLPAIASDDFPRPCNCHIRSVLENGGCLYTTTLFIEFLSTVFFLSVSLIARPDHTHFHGVGMDVENELFNVDFYSSIPYTFPATFRCDFNAVCWRLLPFLSNVRSQTLIGVVPMACTCCCCCCMQLFFSTSK